MSGLWGERSVSPILYELRLKLLQIGGEVFSDCSRKWVLLWQKLCLGHGGVPN